MEKKIHHPIIRTVYLYLFALVGLVLLIIGLVRFVDMGLKAYVFTKAEDEERLYDLKPPTPYELMEVVRIKDNSELSREQKDAIERWLGDYDEWVERSENFDAVTARRHRNASTNLSMILIGLPLFFYHWRIIQRETKKKKKNY
ncbi:MAG: hypothetical protein AVO34_01730 [Firmicutes bacterium ML8_F2]|jgi:hypothetical protein|nr:MAG: hypothetical protein AVO34_01730 [Firmicutes bacterium ML8_F2]